MDAFNETLSKPETSLGWVFQGIKNVMALPAFVLMGAFVGFGALIKQLGLDLGHGLAMTALMWALPSQIVLVGALLSGAGLFAAFIAVALSSVRFTPMIASIIPLMKDTHTSKAKLLFASHFVAITSWVDSMRRFPDIPREFRLSYFLGFAVTLTVFNLGTTALGFWLASQVPPIIAGALFFLMPVYFMLSLWGAARISADRVALLGGLIAGPFFHVLEPEFDLIWAGLVGGSIAFGVHMMLLKKASLP
jgi:predicted branched-subunit amino acid permease